MVDGLVRPYDITLCEVYIGNMLVIVLLALKQTLQSADADPSVRELTDPSLLAVEHLGQDME